MMHDVLKGQEEHASSYIDDILVNHAAISYTV